MDYLSKKRKVQTITAIFTYILFIVLSIILLVLRDPSQLKAEYIINISVDIFGMVMGYVLFVCCLIDVQRTGARNLYFFYLINVTFVGLFTDLIAWIVDGIPSLNYVNIVDNTVYYISMPLEAIFFWLYVTEFLGIDSKKEQIINLIMRIGLVVTLITRVLNILFGFYFTVDASGHYSRSQLYPISMIYAFFTSVATIVLIVKKRRKLQTYQFVALMLYIFLPVAITIFTMFTYGLSISYGVMMLVMLLMYCVLNIAQGRDKVINDRDLKMAAVIQESVIPHIFPPFPDRSEFEIFASMDAAKDVGGDFYDFFLVDDDHLCLVIADVSGKGVPASLFMMISKILIKSHIQAGESLGEALANVNNILLDGSSTEMFVTVWAAMIEISTGKGIAVNAGHEHPVLRRSEGDYEFVKYRHSPAVGTVEDIPFREHEFELHKGDSIFVYTDGVPEAINQAEEFFGTEKLIDTLNKYKDLGPEELLKNVKKDIDAFIGNAKQFDDITMLGIRYKG